MSAFALSGFSGLYSHSLLVKHTSHSARRADAHKTRTSAVMLYEILLYWQTFPHESLPLEELHQSLLDFSCNILSKCKKFQAVSDCNYFFFS